MSVAQPGRGFAYCDATGGGWASPRLGRRGLKGSAAGPCKAGIRPAKPVYLPAAQAPVEQGVATLCKAEPLYARLRKAQLKFCHAAYPLPCGPLVNSDEVTEELVLSLSKNKTTISLNLQ